MKHRAECEMVKLPKYGICNCDYRARIEAGRHALTGEKIAAELMRFAVKQLD
jgi:hypothetical protein